MTVSKQASGFLRLSETAVVCGDRCLARLERHRVATAIVTGALFLLFFVSLRHYHLPSTLELSVQVETPTECLLQWDSGAGFNEHEQLRVTVTPTETLKSVALPQLDIRQLKIASRDRRQGLTISAARIVTAAGTSSSLIVPSPREESAVCFSSVRPETRRFHPLLFAVQLFLALLMGWFAYEFLGLRRRRQYPDWRAAARYAFCAGQHWIFWCLFVFSVAVFSLWLVGQWPGAGTPDSFYQWFQTKSLQLEDSHPYVSTLYFLVLQQFFDSFAVAAIVHIVALSALAAYVYYFLVVSGLSLWCVLPFYFCFVFSIPVGLFNLILWKDVPFSILVVFFAFGLYWLGIHKRRGIPVILRVTTVAVVAALFVLMCLMRHNGILYVIVFPALLLVFGLLPRRVFLTFAVFTVVGYGVFKYMVPPLLKIPQWSKSTTSLAWKINPLISLLSHRSYYSDNPEQDAKTLACLGSFERLKNAYNPNHGGSIFEVLNLDGLSADDVAAVNRLFYTRIVQNLPIYLAERVHLFAVLVISPKCMVWVNEFTHDYYHTYIYNWGAGTVAYVKFSPKSRFLHRWQLKLLTRTFYVPVIRTAMCNLLYPIIVLALILFLYHWSPLSARSAAFVLLQVPFFFVFLVAPDFRYLYFVYLFCYFALPMVLLELHLNTPSPVITPSDAQATAAQRFIARWYGVRLLIGAVYVALLLPWIATGLCLVLR